MNNAAVMPRPSERHEPLTGRILDHIPSSLLVINQHGRIVAANRNFYKKSRRTPQTTLGQTLDHIFPKALIEYTHLDQTVRDILRSGQRHEGGKLAYRAPGLPPRIYFYRLIPLQNSDSAPHVLLLMDDITEQEHLLAEVRRVEQRLASVVECANDLVISLDPRGQIVTWNRAAEQVCGLGAEQVRGRVLSELCHAEGRAAMAALLAACAAAPPAHEPVRHAEASLLTADGQQVPIAWNCSPMRDEAGHVVGIVALGRDLTERRRMEAQLIQSAKMASLGVMAGGIAHELRNPLGIIAACAQLLGEDSADPALRDDCTTRICAATQRAALIIENLLKFARPPHEQMCMVDLRQILAEALPLLRHHLLAQQISIATPAAPDLPLVYGNPALLQQVFINLILNACDAMPAGGTLTVALETQADGQVLAHVADTGCGIAPQHLASIFDPFFTTRPVGKGTGLGLSLCYSIVQQHHGAISVASQVGRGTTFTLCLPTHNPAGLPAGGDDV